MTSLHPLRPDADPVRCVAGLPIAVVLTYLFLMATATVVYSVWCGAAMFTVPDSVGYLEVARDLSDFQLDALHTRGPGYPLLLVLSGSVEAPTHALYFLSLGIHFASIWMLAAVLHRAGVRALLLVLFAIYFLLPQSMQSVVQVASETATEFGLTAGVAALCLWLSGRRAGWLAAACLAIAFAGMVRASHQTVAVAIAAALLCLSLSNGGHARRFRMFASAALLVTLVSAGFILSYSWLNERSFGYFGMSSTMGFTLSTRVARVLEQLPDEESVLRDALIQARDHDFTTPGGDHLVVNFFFSEGMGRRLQGMTGLSEPALSAHLAKLFTALIAAAPMNYLHDVLSAAATYWMPIVHRESHLGGPTLEAACAALQLGFVGLFFLQLVGVGGVALLAGTRALRGHPAERDQPVASDARLVEAAAYLLSLAVVLYTVVISSTFSFGEPRLRAPTEMLMAVMIVLGIEMWARWSRPLPAAC